MIRIGVLGTSSISERRMIPAIRKEPEFRYAGVAYSTREEMGYEGSEADFTPLLEKKKEKAVRFRNSFGGEIYESYMSLLTDPEIDAVYVALPPALHAVWIRKALEEGKHVLAEKPFTTSENDARELTEMARSQGLAIIENYGFPYHTQMEVIRQWLAEDAIGELRLVRAAFGFPHRDVNDFRYDAALGGGALLDCGGYTIKAATCLLGPEVTVVSADAFITEGHVVDIAGAITVRNSQGLCAQLAYGMDHAYRCEMEIWGSRGIISAPRIFTAPDGFPAPVMLKRGQETEEKKAADDQFQRIVQRFLNCVRDEKTRNDTLDEILCQSELTEKVRNLQGKLQRK